MNYELKLATVSDLNKIKQWLDEQKKQDEETFLCNFDLTTQICNENKLLVYYDKAKDMSIAYLWLDFGIVEVKKDYQNKGIGTKFVKDAFEYIKNNIDERCLDIECKPLTTRKFWEKLGFTFYNEINGYYIIEEKLNQPKNGINVKITIKLYSNDRDWNKTSKPIKIIESNAIEENNIIYLPKSISICNRQELWNGDLFIEVLIDGKIIFEDKAKRKEANKLGIKDTGKSYTIKTIQV